MITAHGNHAHGFGSPCNHHLGEPSHDALGGQCNRLQSGGAEAVDSHRRATHRQARAQGGDARHVVPLLGFGHGATQDDILNLLRVEAGNAAQNLLNHRRSHVVRAGVSQCAAGRLANRRSRDGCNNRFLHSILLSSRNALTLFDALAPDERVTNPGLRFRSHLLFSISQRLPFLQHVLNALHGLSLTAQADKGFALQV